MFYNFGLLGSAVAIVILALILHMIARKYFIISDIADYTLIQILCLAGMSVSLGSWIAGSPLTVLNQGFFAYLLLYIFCTRYDPGRPSVKAAANGRKGKLVNSHD